MIETLPDEIEKAIVTPHEHEGPNDPPVWLVWRLEEARTGIQQFPVLDCVCSTERSARYHALATLNTPRCAISVERIPLDHRFGSSIPNLTMKVHMDLWKERLSIESKRIASLPLPLDKL